MNKLKTVINNLRYAFLLLFFILINVSVNGQVTAPNNTTTKDTVQVGQKSLDTIPNTVKRTDSVNTVKRSDTILPVVQGQDTIKTKKAEPIVLDRTKKYLLGGITVAGNETISEQSILIFSGLNPGQRLKIPGDKLSSAIKKLWTSKLFSNVDVFVTKMDGDAIYLEINVRELDKVGKVTITGLKKNKLEDLEKEIEFQTGSMLT